MRILRNIMGFVILVVESVIISHFICDPGTETTLYIVLSVMFAFIPVIMFHSCDKTETGLFIGIIILSAIIIPFVSVFATIIVELIMKIIGIFGIKGSIGIGIIIAMIIGLLSNCVIIFFF